MKRDAVSSSNIAEVGYDSQFATLEVQFVDGKVYQYFDVPSNVYDEMMASDSVGKYFSSHVRGTYRYARV